MSTRKLEVLSKDFSYRGIEEGSKMTSGRKLNARSDESENESSRPPSALKIVLAESEEMNVVEENTTKSNSKKKRRDKIQVKFPRIFNGKNFGITMQIFL
jgi:hypothetical protein